MASLTGLPRNGRHRQEEPGIDLTLCLARLLEDIEAKSESSPEPEPNQLQLFDDPDPDPYAQDRRQPEAGMTTLVRVARSADDRAHELLCLAFFLDALSMVRQASPSDVQAAELIIQQGSLYEAALCRAKSRKQVRSVRGRLHQSADYLIDLVEKMTLQPHFLVLLRSLLHRLPRTYARPGIPGNGL